jgi:hypothetical protein
MYLRPPHRRLCDTEASAWEADTVVLYLRTVEPLVGCVPHSGPVGELGLLLPASSALAHAVLMQLPAWRLLVQQRHGAPATPDDSLPADLARAYTSFLRRSPGTVSSSASRAVLRRMLGLELDMAWRDLMVSEVVPSNLKAKSAPPLLTLIVGLPGSGVSWLSKQLHELAGGQDGEDWAHASVVLPPSGDPQLSPISTALKAAVQGNPKRVLLSVCGLVGLPALGIYLRQHHASDVRLASASACIALGSLSDKDCPGVRWPAFLWDQATPGWCSSVVITEAKPATAAELGPVMHRLRLANRSVDILRASRGCFEPHALGDLLATDRFESPEAEALRRASVCPSYMAVDVGRLLRLTAPAELTAQQVQELPQGIDVQRLVRCLKEIFPDAAAQGLGALPASKPAANRADSTTPAIRRLAELAREKVQDDKTAQEAEEELQVDLKAWRRADSSKVSGESLNCAVIVWITAGSTSYDGRLLFFTCPQNGYGVQSIFGVVVDSISGMPLALEATAEGISLSEAGASDAVSPFVAVVGCSAATAGCVGQLLQIARPYVRRPKALRTRASMSEEEVKQVLAKAQAEQRALPDGFWYDGSAYVDYYGTRLYQRPDKEELVEEYLLEANKRIEAANKMLLAS